MLNAALTNRPFSQRTIIFRGSLSIFSSSPEMYGMTLSRIAYTEPRVSRAGDRLHVETCSGSMPNFCSIGAIAIASPIVEQWDSCRCSPSIRAAALTLDAAR